MHFLANSGWIVTLCNSTDAFYDHFHCGRLRLGINTQFYKMVSLTISAALIGVAGALYMNYMGFIDPQVVFSLPNISIMAILVGIVGGVGTIYGPAVGAFIMIAVQEFFRTGAFGVVTSIGKATKLLSSFRTSDHISHLSNLFRINHNLWFT